MINEIRKEGYITIGKFDTLSEQEIGNILSLLSQYNEEIYLTLAIRNGNYLLRKIPFDVADNEFISMRNYDGFSKGSICVEQSYKDAISIVLNSQRFRKILNERYSSYSNIYYSLFTKLLSQPISFETYNSLNSVTPNGQTISEVIDEFMICHGLLKKSISEDCAKSLQIINSFCAGLTIKNNKFILGLYKDYYISVHKKQIKLKKEQALTQEENLKKTLKELVIDTNTVKDFINEKGVFELGFVIDSKVTPSQDYNYWCDTNGLSTIYNVLSNDENALFGVGYSSGCFTRLNFISGIEVLLKSNFKDMLKNNYYKHFLKEGDYISGIEMALKGTYYNKDTIIDLIRISKGLSNMLGHYVYISLKNNKGVLYLSNN